MHTSFAPIIHNNPSNICKLQICSVKFPAALRSVCSMAKESKVEMETQTPIDIEADSVPLSLSQRPLPQGDFDPLSCFWMR